MKSQLIIFILALGTVLLGLLIGPRVAYEDQIKFCVANIDLPGPFGISLNCDSSEFMLLANSPSKLLENNVRTARPGLIFVAYGLTNILSPLMPNTKIVTDASVNVINQERTVSAMAKNGAAFIAYLILNIVILIVSFVFLRYLMLENLLTSIQNKKLSPYGLTATITAFGLLLVSNDVVKAFVWSPHTQMFNILVPVLCIWTMLKSWHGYFNTGWRAFLYTICIGLGVTAYPTFILCLVCMLVPGVLQEIRNGRVTLLMVLRLITLIGLTLLPYLAWYFIVKNKMGSFYYHETSPDFNQVFWMLDALNDGVFNFLLIWFGNFIALIEMALHQIFFAIISIFWTLFFLLRSNSVVNLQLTRLKIIIICCCLVAFLFITFFASVGLILPRTAFTIVPTLIVAAGIFAVGSIQAIPHRNGIYLGLGYAVIGVIAAIVTIYKEGPWS